MLHRKICCLLWILQNIIYHYKKYRVMSVLKVETDIITSITLSLIWWAVILVITYLAIFKTDVIVFIGNIIMCLTSHWPIIFCIRVSSLIQKTMLYSLEFFLVVMARNITTLISWLLICIEYSNTLTMIYILNFLLCAMSFTMKNYIFLFHSLHPETKY